MVLDSIEFIFLLWRLNTFVTNALITFFHALEPERIGPEDFIERINESRRRTVSRFKPHDFVIISTSNLSLRVKIGADIRPPEGIDRLPGIADNQQRSLFRIGTVVDPVDIMREDAPEYRPLLAVGILEFVHQRNTVFTANGLEQLAFLARFGLFDDDIMCPIHKIVECQCGHFLLKALEHRPCKECEICKHLRGKHVFDIGQRLGEILDIWPKIKKPYPFPMSVHGWVHLLTASGTFGNCLNELGQIF